MPAQLLWTPSPASPSITSPCSLWVPHLPYSLGTLFGYMPVPSPVYPFSCILPYILYILPYSPVYPVYPFSRILPYILVEYPFAFFFCFFFDVYKNWGFFRLQQHSI